MIQVWTRPQEGPGDWTDWAVGFDTEEEMQSVLRAFGVDDTLTFEHFTSSSRGLVDAFMIGDYCGLHSIYLVSGESPEGRGLNTRYYLASCDIGAADNAETLSPGAVKQLFDTYYNWLDEVPAGEE